ncbi:MAG: hypothetical protein UU95_C0021G0010 [Parcubacteria group bacterium GW2011_GWC2_42_12]|uniref:Uncharacterized protein n=2 Tax=Candidatus Falkowiibacteriota TaxID=1752728 RepID=A0A1F5SAA3_9BACT|nr:MAG: hypothetical protein UU43_C0002G0015 [Candidatus Falkowbacteria bacterium GW2011_GWA2_41_14]KKS33839.1 MAG: hypothetical protein UU95_C0021G0010 [Parcubacteria group bacterium GW2011_GWC2_42_12]OGF23201.1 MAG: hypothetical protein A3D45_01315 [Candidatus Falkowbacteria bacterium RIFCSPHIGHO2_02_FULL_42_9]
MTEIQTASNAELADRRPSKGEYFYHDGIERYSAHNTRPMCFACGNKTERIYSSCWYINAIVQCVAAKQRIISMFRPGTCYDSDLCNDGGARIIVSVCEEHKRHAEILCHLTADGVITANIISRAVKALISRPEFNQLVAEAAHAIWSRNEQDRKHHNWCDAWGLFLKGRGRIPSLAERTERARCLWQERKENQSLEDWLAAEKEVSALYTVDAQ